MTNIRNEEARRQVGNWLLLGVAMIVIQVLLGGITRLTESGLSITEWKPITGTLPPLNAAAWQAEFDKYKGTDQFRYVHQDFSINDFKFIFFWEWFHRLWARLMGMVFLIGFLYFISTRKLNKEMITPMIILFALGALQGLVGWLMVKSGLVPEKYFVGHIELTTHLIMALLLLAYTLWFALKLKLKPDQVVRDSALHNLLLTITVFLILQLIYGGFMAGLRAAPMAPTWPDINTYLIPPGMDGMSPGVKNWFYNPITIHFIHRGLAYLLSVLIIFGWFKSRRILGKRVFRISWSVALLLVIGQVILGILTVLNAPYSHRLVWLGVSHQFTGMLLTIAVTCLLFISRRKLHQSAGSGTATIHLGS
jgi:cytochrome c oxidase assembly protein subunit 15